MRLDAVRERVRELARRDKLDKLLAKHDDDRLPWSEWLFVVSWLAYASAGVAVYFLAEGPRGANDMPPVAAMVPPAVLILVGASCMLLAKLTVPAWERRRKRLGGEGFVVPVQIVQANSAWHDDDNQQWWPGTIVFSLDADALTAPERLQPIARALFALKQKDRRALPPDRLALAWDLYHEMGPTQTLPVPAALTKGLPDVWMASAMLPPAPLEFGDSMLALVLPGDTSPDAVAVLPAAVMR